MRKATLHRLSENVHKKLGRLRLVGFVLVITGLVGVTSASFATTIVVLAWNGQVTMGCDSRLECIGPGQTTSGIGCKIQQTGKVFVAAAGILGGRGFNVYNVARTAVQGGGDVAAVADRFERLGLNPFSGVVQGLAKLNPKGFEKWCKGVPGGCLQVAFAGLENGAGAVSIRSFIVTGQGGQIVVRPGQKVDWPRVVNTAPLFWILGDRTEAGYLYDRTPQFFKVRGYVNGIDDLIAEEARTHPEMVSRPISILTIDRLGPRWELGHQGACPRIKFAQPITIKP